MPEHAPPQGGLSICTDGKAFTTDHRAAKLHLALSTHSTPWRPAGATLAAMVDAVAAGMDPDGKERRRLPDAIRLVAATSYLGQHAMAAGLLPNAVSNFARAVAEIEKLADAGSEDAAVSLLTWATSLQSIGICAEVFASTRQIIAEEPR